ncbi:MAG: site-2 protease family protein [Candidatus Wildermuthbacteria bacterium]|nr:site-2 protease family protein [Candidatus Wildermuthbacteria bacterium]
MIFIAIASILVLVILHELGHFFVARKFGVKVEEFGIGLPPRIWGKQFGETLYSINLLPLGAFVRMAGEEKRSNDPRSFSRQSVFARMLIVAGGVLVFWGVAAVLFAGLGAITGIPTSIDDEQEIPGAQVHILAVSGESPAESAGIQAGDIVLSANGFEITKVGQLQDLAKQSGSKELVLDVKRGSETVEITAIPRENPPEGEGALGVMLGRTAFIKFPWYQAPFQGVKIAGIMTAQIIQGLWNTILSVGSGQGLPQGTQMTGPVGIVFLLQNTLAVGIPSFLFFVGMLSVYLAVFNVLPIPAADGGRLLFLGIELFRKKPLAEHIEQKIIGVSFAILIAFLIFVTIKDISRLL